jgi:hypothetical protein
MGKSGGRPRKWGDRYPSGKLHHENKGQDLTPALLGRIKNFFVKIAADPKAGDLPGLLLYDNKLTNPQAAAAYKLGDVYRKYHRLKALRDFAKSPSFERGFGNSDLDEERMSYEQLSDLEADIRKAEEAWRKVDEFLDPYKNAHMTRRLRQSVIDLCVFETLPDPGYLPQIRRVLDQLSLRWAQGWREAKRRDIKIIREAPKRDNVEEMSVKRRDTITEPLEKVLGALGLDDGGVRKAVEAFHALRARAEFRRAKERTNDRSGNGR